ncbi:hypothetical protein [Hyphomicrobium sp. ghe19]|uniref:hypothetical protein n=1 Tax=Hyphomicrobium sp. ghe19 TaxID=2682968 RepID=UPI000B8581EC
MSSMKIRAWTAHRPRDLATVVRRMYQSMGHYRKPPPPVRVALSRLSCGTLSIERISEKGH